MPSLFLRGVLALLLPPLASLGLASSTAAAQKPAAAATAAGFAAGSGEKDVVPLDAVLAVVEDQPILWSQLQTRLHIMRKLGGPGQPAIQDEQVYGALLDAQLIAWDAERLRLENRETDMERMLDALAAKQGLAGGRSELLALVRKQGVDEKEYLAYLRQSMLEARWEVAAQSSSGASAPPPASTRGKRLAALEAEALIERSEGLAGLRPSSDRTCLPKTLPTSLPAPTGKERMVAAVCIEGPAMPETAARLAALSRTVIPQAPLSRDAVARSLTELVTGGSETEFATVYGLPLRPGNQAAGPLLVVYRLRPRPLLSGIELQGIPQGVVLPPITIAPNTRYSHRELRSHLRSTLSELQYTGYLSATVHSERLPVRSPSEPQRVRFTLLPGARTYIARIALPGVAASRLAELQGLLGFRAGDPLSELALIAGREKLGEYFLNHGFLKASVAPHTTEAAAPRADGSPQVAVRMDVTEGKQYQLGIIKMTGALPLPEAELKKQIKTPRGVPLRAADLRQDVKRLTDAGQSAGKPVVIDVMSSINEATATLDLTLDFTPAPPAR